MQKTLNGITIKTKGTKSLGVLFGRFQIKAREFGLSDKESYAWLCVGLKIPLDQQVTQADFDSACEKLGKITSLTV